MNYTKGCAFATYQKPDVPNRWHRA